MATIQDTLQWRGHTVVDSDGDKIGKLEEIYLDARTNQPEWALVHTGLFGSKSTFIPLQGAEPAGDDLKVPYDKAKVKDAPKVEADGQLSPEEETELYRYYGVDYDAGDTGSTGHVETHAGQPGGPGQDTSGPNTDNAMTRSEEELSIGKTQHEVGRARLRKYIVTENVTQTVPVQREEVRVEREPITEGNAPAAHDGPALSEEEHEVTLRAEEPVVEKKVVPKERVRLDTETVTEERQVNEEVRSERIDVDEDAGRR